MTLRHPAPRWIALWYRSRGLHRIFTTSNVTADTEVWSASFGLVLHVQHIFANSGNVLVRGALGECYYNTLLCCDDYSSSSSVVSTVFKWEKKKNQNALSPNAEGVRRGAEDRAPKAWGVSMQLGGLVERCKLPQRGRAEPGCPPNDIRCIFGLKMLYPAKYLLAKTYA